MADLKALTLSYMAQGPQLCSEQAANEFPRLDLQHEVEHMADRVKRLEESIRDAMKLAPVALQSDPQLAGIA